MGTYANLFQISLEIILLPVQTEDKAMISNFFIYLYHTITP